MNATQTKHIFNYLHWFFRKLLGESGPVVETDGVDLLLEREDPLLNTLVKAGQLASAKSGVFAADGDARSREEALARPLELPRRVWLGDTETSFALDDSIPDGYLEAFQTTTWATNVNDTPVLLGPRLDVWQSPTTVEGFTGKLY